MAGQKPNNANLRKILNQAVSNGVLNIVSTPTISHPSPPVSTKGKADLPHAPEGISREKAPTPPPPKAVEPATKPDRLAAVLKHATNTTELRERSKEIKATSHLNRLATAKEVADACRISLRTLHRLTMSGDFPQPIFLPGKKKRWIVDEVNEWLFILRGRSHQAFNNPYAPGAGTSDNLNISRENSDAK